MEVEKQIIVREEHIDELNHVNNSVYLKYLEYGRGTWYKQKTGCSYEDFQKMNLAMVVLRSDVWYRQEALLNDVLTVITKPKRLGNTSFDFTQKIINEKEELICEATIMKVMMDLKTRKSTPVIKEIADPFKEALN